MPDASIENTDWVLSERATRPGESDSPEGEIPFHLAMVVNINRLALKDRFGEFEKCHVRSSPRTIDREETKTGTGYLVQMCVAMREHLVGFLGRRVETHWMIGVMNRRKGLQAIESVNARTARKDQMLDLIMPTRFKDGHRSIDVRLRVSIGVLD